MFITHATFFLYQYASPYPFQFKQSGELWIEELTSISNLFTAILLRQFPSIVWKNGTPPLHPPMVGTITISGCTHIFRSRDLKATQTNRLCPLWYMVFNLKHAEIEKKNQEWIKSNKNSICIIKLKNSGKTPVNVYERVDSVQPTNSSTHM